MKNKLNKKLCAIVMAVMMFFPLLTACNRGIKEKPTVYTIDASLDIETMTLTAQMTVDYVNKSESSLTEIMFHLYPNAYREGAVYSPVPAEDYLDAYRNGESYGGISVSNVKVNGVSAESKVGGEDENILTVPLASVLDPTDKVEISMDFTVSIPNVRHRLGHFGGIVNLGNFYPIACVKGADGFYTDPYYDRGDPFYSDIADYHVTLSVPEGMVAETSGKLEKSVVDTRTVYKASQKNIRDFAASVGAFRTPSTMTGGVDINYYYIKDETPEVSLIAASDAIKTFNHLFGEYPYDVYSVVETHFLQGGMEYPTLAYVSDALNREMLTEAIVHETAHQWWYGVVGNNEVAHAWMDEGLAELSTTMFYERNTDYNVDAKKRKANTLSAYIVYYDSGINRTKDTSMTRALNEYDSSFEYAFLNYAKAELMFESVRLTVGEEKFLEGLKRYYADMKFKNATPDDLIGALETVSERSLKPTFTSWLSGKVMIFGGDNAQAAA